MQNFNLPSLLLPAPLNAGFSMPGYWVWCGSVIKGDDNRYHMFASRWPQSIGFNHWATNSEIVRASADSPVGPFRFEEVVLPPRPGNHFDARVTHNPCIARYQDTYLLFYTGTTFDGPTPTPNDQAPQLSPRWQQSWHNKRIGLAAAKSIFGPWTRPSSPILQTRPDHWDAVITSNPAACVRADGRILLLYKSTPTRHDPIDGSFRGRFMLGAAVADHFSQPFRRLSDTPVLQFDNPNAHVEDPYVWHDGARYRAIMKDMSGEIGGEAQAGISAHSDDDGTTWQLSSPVQAYSRKVRWANNTTTRPAKLERPQLLIENQIPTHLYLATCDSEKDLSHATRTWSMVIPLKTPS